MVFKAGNGGGRPTGWPAAAATAPGWPAEAEALTAAGCTGGQQQTAGPRTGGRCRARRARGRCRRGGDRQEQRADAADLGGARRRHRLRAGPAADRARAGRRTGAGGGPAAVERVADDRLNVTINDEIAFDYKSAAIRPTSCRPSSGSRTCSRRRPHAGAGRRPHQFGRVRKLQPALSLARAASVRDALATYGVDPPRIRAERRGEAEPRVDNDTEARRAANRRVEILITSIAQGRRRLPAASTPAHPGAVDTAAASSSRARTLRRLVRISPAEGDVAQPRRLAARPCGRTGARGARPPTARRRESSRRSCRSASPLRGTA